MGFSRQCGISDFPIGVPQGPHHLSSRISTGLQAWTKTSNTSLTYPSASPLLITSIAGSGILTGYPSTTPFGLALGSTNPGRINLPQETLDFRRYGFSPQFSLLIPTGSLVSTPAFLTVCLHRMTLRSSTARINASAIRTHGFGYTLEPRSF